jgi:hypothetical protein
MVDQRDLVALLHRADWTRLCLSGEVRGVDESMFSMLSFPKFSVHADLGAEQGLTLLLAPGRRYRAERPGGRQVRGCDGERTWLWVADEPTDPGGRLVGGPQPPFPTLLAPSWLLERCQLTIEGDTTACGRAAIRVEATPRTALPAGRGSHVLPFSVMPMASRPASRVFRFDHVSAIVDAELGILLSCERRRGDDPPELTEFVSLTTDPDTDATAFIAPPGSVTSAPTERQFGREAAKTAAGLAAGGLGAMIRYGPFGRERVDPFARATEEDDPEPEMPADDPLPGGVPAAPVSDRLLHLLYRSGGVVPRLTCALHQWVDLAALISAVPEAARRTGFGGVGLLVDAVVDASRSTGSSVAHEVRRVRIDGWDKYRIDRIGRPGKGDQLLTLACDGERRWKVYADRVVRGPAGPPPDELADLLDGSWLLACDLSGEEEITVGGRRAYRFAVDARQTLPEPFALLAKLTFPAVAVADAETGQLLRLTTYKGGKPAVRHEIRDLEPGGEGGDFGFEVPAGLPVVEESGEHSEAGQAPWESAGTPVDAAKAAARGLFDSLRRARPPR